MHSRSALSWHSSSMLQSAFKIHLAPRSCDTFVALPSVTSGGCIIFGKNSDRPDDEEQHVVAYPAASFPQGSSLQCTYISIPQAPAIHAVILSKPAWMWGAEMAANEAGLVIGNEAVWTKEPDDGPPALLGMDIVRLVAERCSTASEAVDTIASLLAQYGQGGPCEQGGDWSYHNSFLIADKTEAWVVETAGKYWAAERITSGIRNISNCLSIRISIDKYGPPDLLEYAKSAGYWNGKGDFDWAAAFSSSAPPPIGQKSAGREAAGEALLRSKTKAPDGIKVQDMMDILRDTKSGICMTGCGFQSNGSQVSMLWPPSAEKKVDVHWFTGTPDPSKSCFKPLTFVDAGASLEEINAGAVALYRHNEKNPKRYSLEVKNRLRELEMRGLEAVQDGSNAVGAALYLELAAQEHTSAPL